MSTTDDEADMNFTTHVMFGLLIGALFFGRPEIALLVGVGAAIPDLDREYGFFTRDRFRDLQIHRALFHNFLFLGILYLINPFVAVGAFSHTLLDALTTTRDRGVEWLFPFSRLTKKVVYTEKGDRIPVKGNPSGVHFYQYDPITLTRLSDEDLKEYKPLPWRRTYGPAVSGKLLDLAIFLGSTVLLVFLVAVSALGLKQFVVIHTSGFASSLALPLLVGMLGILIQLSSGEVDRRRQLYKRKRPEEVYKALFFFSLALMVSSVILGAYLNPVQASAVGADLPYVAVGAIIIAAIAIALIRYSRYLPRPFVPTADGSTGKKNNKRKQKDRHEEDEKKKDFDQSKVGERDDPIVL